MTSRYAKNPAMIETFARGYPLGRVGTSDDVADAVSWLSSDGCFMTGQVVQINGGLTLRRNPTNAEIMEAFKADRAATANTAPA